MKQKLTKVTCDTCGATIEFGEDESYPYTKGWHYLYKFGGKVPRATTHSLTEEVGRFDENDCHFCSVNCMGKFIEKKILEASTTQPVKMDNESFNSFS